jgi:hypothetical protein
MTNETDNTKEGLLNRYHVVISALFEAHEMSKSELRSELEAHLDNYEDSEVDDDMPDESMDGDFDSGMASAGFGTDEDYNYYDREME